MSKSLFAGFIRQSFRTFFPALVIFTGLASATFAQGLLGTPGRAFDFDGDGKADLSVFRPSNATWYINNSSNGTTSTTNFCANSDVLTPHDYDGDGRYDLSCWRPSNATWYIRYSSGGSAEFPFGQTGDIPVPGDYDADNRADLAVFRQQNAQATWTIKYTTNGSTVTVPFGNQMDVPVPADYDGDGRTDLAIVRNGSANWTILYSSTNTDTTIHWGQDGDRAVPADYDGDGKDDLAVWRPDGGVFYVLKSSTNNNGEYIPLQWGQNGDLPVTANYNNSNVDNFAVWRPSNNPGNPANYGVWYVLNNPATGNYTATPFGLQGDRPLPNVYVRIIGSGGLNQPPVASFTFSPRNPFEGDLVFFDASASSDSDGSIVSYTWDFGDGSPLETTASSSISHSFDVGGSYTVSLTVTDNRGATTTTQRIVFVRTFIEPCRSSVPPCPY